MSYTKRMLEREQSAQELLDALQALIDHERLEHPASEGIARKIIADRSTENLSERQLEVFDDYIQRELTIPCDGFCDDNISLMDIPATLSAEQVDGMRYCQHCRHDIEKLKR